jgi:hypothetical protein
LCLSAGNDSKYANCDRGKEDGYVGRFSSILMFNAF